MIFPLLGACVLLGMGACVEFTFPRRGDPDLVAKLVGFGALLILILSAWLLMSDLRPWLVSVPLLAFCFHRLRARERLDGVGRTLLRAGWPFAALFAMLMTLMVGENATSPSSVVATSISPDSRWEARVVEHHGVAYCVDEVILLPRGLSTLNPFAYPSSSLGELTMEGDLDSMTWENARTLVLCLRPQSAIPPDLNSHPEIAVKVINLVPPPKQ